MKVTEKFLESLSGLTPEVAESFIKDAGLIPILIPFGKKSKLIARLNAVIIWLNPNGLVRKATKGW